MGLGNHNGMFSDFVGEITLCRIRLQFGQDVPDSGQEHPAHSDDRFLVPTTSLDSAVAFFAFGIFVGFDDRIGNLNQQRFQVAASTGDASGFHLPVTLVIPRAAASPGNQVLRGGKYRHIHADLGDESNSCQWSSRKPRDSANQFQLVRVRFRKPKDFGFDMLPVFIELVDMQQTFLEFDSLFTRHSSINSGLNFFNRVFAAPVDKWGNVKMLTRMFQNVLNDGT